jgi:hypothetical protein
MSCYALATAKPGGQKQDAVMFRVIWHDAQGAELGLVNARERRQAEQKIRATVSRRSFAVNTAFRLDCPDSERQTLTEFIKSEMASAAAMVSATLEP